MQRDRYPFNSLFSRTTWVSGHQKGWTSLDFNDARDDRAAGPYANHLHSKQITTPVPHLLFLQVECSSWHPTNSIRALKALQCTHNHYHHHNRFYSPFSGTTWVRLCQKRTSRQCTIKCTHKRTTNGNSIQHFANQRIHMYISSH